MEDRNEKEKKEGYVGPFYWNPGDKRVFVPKRWGYGWTVNFANPFSILALFSILIVVLILAKLL